MVSKKQQFRIAAQSFFKSPLNYICTLSGVSSGINYATSDTESLKGLFLTAAIVCPTYVAGSAIQSWRNAGKLLRTVEEHRCNQTDGPETP